jgi:hypothetical protein
MRPVADMLNLAVCNTCAYWDVGDDPDVGLCRWRPKERRKHAGQRCGEHQPHPNERRLAKYSLRLYRLIELNAPTVIVLNELRMIQSEALRLVSDYVVDAASKERARQCDQ